MKAKKYSNYLAISNEVHHHLCKKSRVYHRWHQHPLHRHVHWGVLGAVVLGVALTFVGLGWYEDAADFTRAVHAASISTADIPTIRSRYLQYGVWGGQVDPSWKSCPDYNNWWENQVGWPHYIADAILTNKISRSEWESALRCYIGKQSTGEPQGANAVWRGMTRLAAGLALDDVGYLNWAVDRIAGSISQGDYSHITHDWGYHFHYDVPNLHYGISHLGEFANYLKISEGTSFAIDADVFFDWVGKGLIWQSINKRYDPYLSAKFPHKWYNWDGVARTLLTTGYSQVAALRQGLEAMANGGNAPYGARSFPQSTYVIARRPSFLVSVKLVNPYEPFLEAANFAPVFGAVNIINTATVGRVEEAQMLDNPAGLLSTMTMPKKYTKYVATPDTENSDRTWEWEVLDAIQKPNPWPRVGVSTLGGYYGIAGHAMEKPSEWAMTRTWFLMDNEVVTLGSGISASGNSGGMETWLETMQSAPASVGTNRMTHGGIGYALLSSNGSTLKSRPGGSGDPDIKSGYTQVYLDHGSNPNGASFALVLLPNASETASYSGTEVLRLDDQAHIVKDTSSGVIGAAFFEPGSGGGISTNEPGYIMMQDRGSEFHLSIFNPRVEESLRGPVPKVYSGDTGGTNPLVDFERDSNFTAHQYQISVPFRLQKAGSGQGLNLFSLSGSNPTTLSAAIRVGRKLELKGARNSDGSYTIVEANTGFNDADAGVTPGNGGCIPSTEICDQKDNDCDTQIDEGNVCGTTNQPPRNLILRYLGPTPTGGNLCGNPPGRIDPGEQCDGANLNGQTCVSLGFSGGPPLSCSSSCMFNTSACTAPPFVGGGNGTVKTSIQQSWVNCEQKAIPDILARFDLVQAPLNVDLAGCKAIYGQSYDQIQIVKQKNPTAIILPFHSAHYNMPGWSADRTLDTTAFVNSINGFKARGFNGMYVDLWNKFASDADADSAATLMRQTWPAGVHVVNAAAWLDSSYATNGYMWEDLAYRSTADVLSYAQTWAAASAQPPVVIINERCIPESSTVPGVFDESCKGIPGGFWQRGRHATSLSLLGDSFYVMFNSGGGGSPHWASNWRFDEWSLDLGKPLGSAKQLAGVAAPNAVWVRFFEKGLVIVSEALGPGKSPSSVTVSSSQLAQQFPEFQNPYYFFRGSQQPLFNTGRAFSSIILDTYDRFGDSLLLLKTPQTAVTDIYIDDEVSNEYSNYMSNIQGTFSHSGFSFKTDAHYFWDAWSSHPYDQAHWATPGAGKTATWRPAIGVAGQYEVSVWYPSKFNGSLSGFNLNQVSQSAQFRIQHANGSTPKSVNQQLNGGQWVSLGTYTFNVGTGGYVELASDSTGYVLADAIKFVYRGP